MSNNEALDDKTVQALAERLGWVHPWDANYSPCKDYYESDPEYGTMYAYEDKGWHLTLAGVAACIEGLRITVEDQQDGGWWAIVWPEGAADSILTEEPTLTAAVTAAVKEMF